MRSEDLIYLAGVAALAKGEYSTPRLSLQASAGVVTASYAGSYTSGQRKVEQPKDVTDFQITVDSEVFAGLCTLLGEREAIKVTCSDRALDLKSRQHSMKIKGAAYDEIVQPAEEHIDIEVDSTLLKAEVALAEDFANKRHNKAVNLTFRTGSVRVMAFNGMSALFLAQVDCKAEQTISLTATATDLISGLTLLGAGPVQVSVANEGRNLIFRNKDAWFRCATLNSQFPDMSSLMQPAERSTVRLLSSQLQAVARSVKTLKATDSVLITAVDGGVTLRTVAAELGQFSTGAEGTLEGEHWFSIELLQQVAKLGDEIALQIGAKINTPSMIVSGKRAVWLMGRTGQ